jgi:site-specific DNA-methyltransferase (cytosine-N4-specific)
MFSLKGDLVVDPFGGTGTTSIAALAAGRSSITLDIDETFINYSLNRITKINKNDINNMIKNRYKNAIKCTKAKLKSKNKKAKYHLKNGDPIYTRQEKNIKLPEIIEIKNKNNEIICKYK